jgi:hypothetical protein
MKSVYIEGFGRVEFPDAMPESQIQQIITEQILPKRRAVEAEQPQPQALPAKSGFMPALRSGVDTYQSNLQSALGGIMDAVGAKELRDSLYQQAKANQESAASELTAPTSWDDVKGTYAKDGIMAAAPRLATHVAELAGQSLPQMAAPMAAMKFGPWGAVAAIAANEASLAGSNIQRQMAEGATADNVGVGKAFAYALPQALMETAGDYVIAGPLLKAANRAPLSKLISTVGKGAEEAAQAGVKRKLVDVAVRGGKDVLKRGAVSAPTEGITESGQQALERMQALGYGQTFTPEGMKEIGDAGMGGLLLGGFLGGITGPIEGMNERRAAAARKAQQEMKARLETEDRGAAPERNPEMAASGIGFTDFGGRKTFEVPLSMQQEAQAEAYRKASGADPRSSSVAPPVAEEIPVAPVRTPPVEGLEAARIAKQRAFAAKAGDTSKISPPPPLGDPYTVPHSTVAPFLFGQASLEEDGQSAPRRDYASAPRTEEELAKIPKAKEVWEANKGTHESLVGRLLQKTTGAALSSVEGARHKAFYEPRHRLVTVSLASDNPTAQVEHEISHVVWTNTSPQEKKNLVTFAKAHPEVFPAARQQMYGERFAAAKQADPKFDVQDAMDDEWVAHLRQSVEEGKVKLAGKPRNIIDKAKREISNLGNSLRGMGYQQADDVLAAIDSGEIGMRHLTGMPSRPLGVVTGEREKDKISDTEGFVAAEDTGGKDPLEAEPISLDPAMASLPDLDKDSKLKVSAVKSKIENLYRERSEKVKDGTASPYDIDPSYRVPSTEVREIIKESGLQDASIIDNPGLWSDITGWYGRMSRRVDKELEIGKYKTNSGDRASLNFVGYWVKPGGEARKLREVETHPQLAGRILKGELNEKVSGDPEGKLMDKGWVRVRSSAVDFNDGVSFEALAAGVNKAVEHAKSMRKEAIQTYKRIPDENELAGYKIEHVNVPFADIPEFLDNPKKYLTKSKMHTYSRAQSRASLSDKPLAPTFYSQLEKTVSEKVPEKAFAPQIQAILNNPQNQVKQEEVKWSGLDEWLGKQMGRKISRQEIQDYLKQNEVQIEEVEKQAGDGVLDSAKYNEYSTPGGSKYRELLLTTPGSNMEWSGDFETGLLYGDHKVVRTEYPKEYFVFKASAGEDSDPLYSSDKLADSKDYVESIYNKGKSAEKYRSPHWDEPNVLAHVRFDDRTIDGKKSLLVEEIQSDWHQRGRKEGYRRNPTLQEFVESRPQLSKESAEATYKDIYGPSPTMRDEAVYPGINRNIEGAPDAPFKKTWHELAFKRILRWAAENGYDRVAWTTGKEQADRYSLAKKVRRVSYDKERENLFAYPLEGGEVTYKVKRDKLSDYIGKDAAAKLEKQIENPSGLRGLPTIAGLDLEIGGEGMKGFYDKILPEFVNKYAKKWGARTGETRLTPSGIPVHFVDVTPSMRQSVLYDGQARFSLTDEPITGKIPEADRSRYAMVAAAPKPKPLMERLFGVSGNLEEVTDQLKAKMLDQYYHVEIMSKKLIEQGYGELTRADRSSIVALRLLVDRAMQFTNLALTDGVIGYDKEAGLMRVLRNKKNEAITPDGKLTKGLIKDLTATRNGKEINLMDLSPDDLVKVQNAWQAVRLNPGRYGRQGKGIPVEKWGQYGKDDWYFKQADTFIKENPWALEMMDKYNVHNKALVKLLLDTGVITQKTHDNWTESPYSPFYRNLEEIEKDSAFEKTPSLKNVKFGHPFKGGEAPVDDLIENITKNISAAVGAATRNVAMRRVLRDASVLGEVTPVPSRAKAANPVTIRIDGKAVHFDVKDSDLLLMLQSRPQFDSGFSKLIAESAGWLRKGITAAPPFWIANVIRDTGQNMLTSGYDINPLRTASKGIYNSFKKGAYTFAGKEMQETPWTQALHDMGISGGINAVRGDGKTKVNLKRIFRRSSKEGFAEDLMSGKFINAVSLLAGRAWEATEAASERSDLVVRAKVFEEAWKANKGKPGAEAQAAYEALETLNFSRHGADASVRWITMAVPFMNARFQGLDVMQRAARGKAANQLKTASGKAQTQARFIKTGFYMAASTLSYAMVMPFFSAYRNANDEERDGYWFVPLDFTDPESVCIRIPIPFEVGAIFKSLPERLWNTMADQKEDGSGGQDLREDLGKFAVRTFLSTFQMNPLPQIVKPAIEVVFNQNFYQGRKIEPAYLEGLAPEYRYTEQTSEASKLISKALLGAASPVQIDHLIRGYFGSIGSYLVDLSGAAIEMFDTEHGEKADAPLLAYKYGVGRFYQRPEGSGKINKFYSAAEDVSQVFQSYMKLMERGDVEEAQKIAEKSPEKIAANDYFSAIKQALGEVRSDMRRVNSDKTMSGEEKKDLLEKLRLRQIELTKDIYNVRREIRRQSQ